MLNVVVYPKCSTCRSAIKWFEANEIPFKKRHIVEEKLSAAELREIHVKSDLPIKKFFNTNGMKYRELGLKDKIDAMTDDACYERLAADGMLVKRPLVYSEAGTVTLGFKVGEYEKAWQ